MKKRIAIILALVMCFGILAACAPDAPPPAPAPEAPAPEAPAPAPAPEPPPPAPVEPPPEDPVFSPADLGNVTIRMSWWGGDSRHEAVIEALELFMDRYPNVTVQYEYGAFGGWREALFQQLIGRTEPDVFQVNYGWVHEFAAGNNPFLNLLDYQHIMDLTEWTDEMRAFTTTLEGDLAAVSHGMNGRVVIYDTRMLAEHGFSEFPQTLEGLVELGEAVSAGNARMDAGNNRYAMFPLGEVTWDWILMQMLYNEIGTEFQVGRQIQYTADQVEPAFEMLGRLIEAGALPSFVQQDPGSDWSHPVWAEGRGGSSLEWANLIPRDTGAFGIIGEDGEETDPPEMGVALFPTLTDNPAHRLILQRPSLTHAVSRNSEHPELAVYLLNFLYTDEEALSILGTQFGIPMSRTATAVAEREGIIVGLMAEGIDLLLEYPGFACEILEMAHVRADVRDRIIEDFRSGRIDAREAAERFVEDQQVALDEMQ